MPERAHQRQWGKFSTAAVEKRRRDRSAQWTSAEGGGVTHAAPRSWLRRYRWLLLFVALVVVAVAIAVPVTLYKNCHLGHKYVTELPLSLQRLIEA